MAVGLADLVNGLIKNEGQLLHDELNDIGVLLLEDLERNAHIGVRRIELLQDLKTKNFKIQLSPRTPKKSPFAAE